jgi:hypothetical protein
MLSIERAYNWVKTRPAEEYNAMKNDLDSATATIRRIFRDNNIRKESVEIMFTADDELVATKKLIEEELVNVNEKLLAIENEREQLTNKLTMLNCIIKVTNVNVDDERERRERTRILQAQAKEAQKAFLLKQQELIARELGIAKSEVDLPQAEQKAKRKKSVVKENGSD